MLRKMELPRNEQLSPLSDPGRVTGFSSPAQDYVQKRLEITEKLIRDTDNTYLFLAVGDGLKSFDIADGDLVIVDKSLPRSVGAQLVCAIDGDFTVRELIQQGSHIYLTDKATSLIDVTQLVDAIELWGTITYVCNSRTVKKNHVRTS